MLIRKAEPNDNEGLLSLTSATSMKGVIGLRIDRNPDFMALLRERGPHHVLIAENQNEIVGSIAVAVHEALILGKLRRVFYISDFKIHPKHQNSWLAFKMVRTLHDYLQSIDADILLCTSILGNEKVEPFFKGQLGIPPFTEMGTFSVLQVLPPLCKKKCSPLIDFADEDESEELSDFFNRMSENYVMTPFTKPEDLNFKINLVKRENGQIVSAICLADYMHLKQNVVTEIPVMLRLISKANNLLGRFISSLHLPEEGEAIRLLNVKRIATVPGKNSDLINLIDCARYLLASEHFTFLTVALHPVDPLRHIFRKLPKFTFYSKVWICSLKGDQYLLKTLQQGILMEDYSLV